jgi:hypothetical protein
MGNSNECRPGRAQHTPIPAMSGSGWAAVQLFGQPVQFGAGLHGITDREWMRSDF